MTDRAPSFPVRPAADDTGGPTDPRGIDPGPRRDEHLLRLALAAAGIAAWEWHIPSGLVSVAGGLGSILGLSDDRPTCLYPSHLSHVHAEDWARVTHAQRRAVAEGAAYDVEFRVVAPDGTTPWLMERGQVVERDQTGRATRVVGVVMGVPNRPADAPPPSRPVLGDPLTELSSRFRNALRGHAARTGREEFTDPVKLATMPDAELRVVRGLGRQGVERVRAVLGSRWEECPRCGGTGQVRVGPAEAPED